MKGRAAAKKLAADNAAAGTEEPAAAAEEEEVNFEGTDEEHAAAAKIQAGFRGHQVRKDMAGKGDDAAAESSDAPVAAPADAEEVNFEGTDEEHAAAAKIQAGFRGHQVRKDMAGKGEGDDGGDGGEGAAADGDAAVAATEGEGDAATPAAEPEAAAE